MLDVRDTKDQIVSHHSRQCPVGRSDMSTNRNRHDGHREGAVRGRSQFQTPSGQWAKRDRATGQIMDVKADPAPFKGVTRETRPGPGQ